MELENDSLMVTLNGTVQCSYNAVNFLPNPHKRHPIAAGVCSESVVSVNSDLRSVTLMAVLYVTSW